MAVKKQTTTRSLKAKTNTVAKKITVRKLVKKTPAKKAGVLKSTQNKTTKKTVVKKSPLKKKTPTKKPPTTTATLNKQAVAKKTPKKTTLAEKISGATVIVSLPENMSIRAREKALVLDHEWKKAMYAIAYSSGLCFAIVGSTLALSSVFGNLQAYQLPATVVAATQTVAARPILQVTTTIPEVINEEFKVSFTINDVSKVQAFVAPAGSLSTIQIEIKDLLNDKYRTVIPANKLSDGWYDFLISNIPENKAYGTVVRKVATFHVGQIPANQPRPDTLDELKTPTNPVVVAPVTPISDEANFRIFSAKTTLSGIVNIGLVAPSEFTYFELYARPLNSLNSQFIGLATPRFNQLQFTFDTTGRLANGSYEFYAQSKNSSGSIVQTAGLTMTVSNRSSVTTNTPTTLNTTTNPEITSENSVPIRINNVETRDFVEVDFTPSTSVDDSVEIETTSILKDNSTDLEKLIRAYAVAKQSGDTMLIEAAEKSLSDKRQSLVFEAMRSDRVKDLADNIDVRITEKIAEIQRRTDAFESIRSERSGGQSAIDTDKDGISDFDEVNLYQTDPLEADSDSDGFTDGAEIIRGFNPNNAATEAVIEFESPRDSIGLVREDVLSINEVIPVISDLSGEPPVLAQIKGQGIPNSFVTLFIFSSPIIVTIKTDKDGSFVYTLDKELSDGTHEVFAVMTDNTGSILGQSNPFSFIKEAEAFTPVDASKANIVTNEVVSIEQNTNAIGTVAGLGILSLGIILIMLGVSLRTKKDDDDSTLQSGKMNTDEPESEPARVPIAKSSKHFEHIDAS